MSDPMFRYANAPVAGFVGWSNLRDDRTIEFVTEDGESVYYDTKTDRVVTL